MFPKEARKYQAARDRIREQIRNQRKGDRKTDNDLEDEDEKIEVRPEEVGEGYFSKPGTMSDFYKGMHAQGRTPASKDKREVAYQMISERGERKLYLDFDPKLHKSRNEQAKKTRKGYRGYHPFYVIAPRGDPSLTFGVLKKHVPRVFPVPNDPAATRRSSGSCPGCSRCNMGSAEWGPSSGNRFSVPDTGGSSSLPDPRPRPVPRAP